MASTLKGVGVIAGIVLIILVCLGVMIAAIVLGAMNQTRCPVESNIPIYLIVLGAVSIATLFVTCGKNSCDDGFCSTVGWAFSTILNMFMGCWFIADCVDMLQRADTKGRQPSPWRSSSMFSQLSLLQPSQNRVSSANKELGNTPPEQLVAVAAGSYWIYRVYPPSFLPDTDRYCHKIMYNFAFVVTTLQWIALGLTCLCGVCIICITRSLSLASVRNRFYGATGSQEQSAANV